ncbi:PAS domain-containing protein [Marinobacter sp.]|uniref:PAS domain-containing protein n=1 Tax=Marinobacter sp. TaxID=50741 RepID=UPI001A090164|nr:PAS domain-containing protein [Marinobacter sp.]MBE0485637.1 PAS domain-containing protein [Marinobacter sp.]
MAFYNRKKLELEVALEQLKEAESRIRELESDFLALERAAAVIVMSQDGIIERVSDLFLDLLGYERDQLIGQHHRCFCCSDYSKSEDYIKFWRQLVTGNVNAGSFPAVHASGNHVYVNARYSPVMSDNGLSRKVIGCIASVVND